MHCVRHFRIVAVALALCISGNVCSAQTQAESDRRAHGSKRQAGSDAVADESRPFELSRIDSEIIDGFAKAWMGCGNGLGWREVVILILRGTGNSYKMMQLPPTNEFGRVTFAWRRDTVAVVHTHANSRLPRPQEDDIKTAQRFGVPVLTLTIDGMYMYDPATKKTIKVHDGTDWLEPSKWASYSQRSCTVLCPGKEGKLDCK